ncbi:alpha-(1,3)-fucosyltransferase 9-like isoform X1 [Thalassophryne amazonica]|uniref:alpha-(1,3)-fucosyltransferase 9-like isoform X1 n=1 Tax=Thalassophryne amazonica TaxID=390379 RepID=UPI0014709081|nr:alpha-(1,3)-fucosyltransferase 9-like isoform X1 [Thalassophryne amazonica]XP_034016762.1 alpha-(1,3)-fucosyltransferase 9-like isoform X1 [Thalassophryne amazonica]
MFSTLKVSLHHSILKRIVVVAGFIGLFLMYYKSFPFPRCHLQSVPPQQMNTHSGLHNTSAVRKEPTSAVVQRQSHIPLMLLWSWPENKRFDLNICKNLLNIDRCHLTDNRSLYSMAHGVVIFHRTIQDDLSNLPAPPRPRFQRWIWFNTDSQKNTRRIPGIEHLFNLTLTYRKDGDIHVQWQLSARKSTDKDFVLPPKQRLICWIVDKMELDTRLEERNRYYRELTKHIPVDVFDRTSLSDEDYFQTISSCKFYLSFEKSDDKDYITETFNGPLAVGTVPIVLGPPRKNYEEFFPGTSFIHVNDFSNAKVLADFLMKLDVDNKTYMSYFSWTRFYTARRHLTEEKYKFAHAICQACEYLSIYNVYRVVTDLYKWYFI